MFYHISTKFNSLWCYLLWSINHNIKQINQEKNFLNFLHSVRVLYVEINLFVVLSIFYLDFITYITTKATKTNNEISKPATKQSDESDIFTPRIIKSNSSFINEVALYKQLKRILFKQTMFVYHSDHVQLIICKSNSFEFINKNKH